MAVLRLTVIALVLLVRTVFSDIISRRVPDSGYGLDQITQHTAKYNTYYDIIVFFGGAYEGDLYNNDVWGYYVTENRWDIMNPITEKISARIGALSFIDDEKSEMFVFSGRGYLGQLNDLWSFNIKDLSWRYRS